MSRNSLTVMNLRLLTRLKNIGKEPNCSLCHKPLMVGMMFYSSRRSFTHVADRVQVLRHHHIKKAFLLCEVCYENSFLDSKSCPTSRGRDNP